MQPLPWPQECAGLYEELSCLGTLCRRLSFFFPLRMEIFSPKMRVEGHMSTAYKVNSKAWGGGGIKKLSMDLEIQQQRAPLTGSKLTSKVYLLWAGMQLLPWKFILNISVRCTTFIATRGPENGLSCNLHTPFKTPRKCFPPSIVFCRCKRRILNLDSFPHEMSL